MVTLLADVLDRLDELVIAVVAASSGGFIGGWMALRAANDSIERSVQASKADRAAAAVADRRAALQALAAELRLNAALVRSEETEHSEVAPAWRIPFRDAYVTALPFLASLPPAIQRSLQHAAVQSSHYTVIATQHNALTGTSETAAATEQAQARHAKLRSLVPNLSRQFLEAANELDAYLRASDPEPGSPSVTPSQ